MNISDVYINIYIYQHINIIYIYTYIYIKQTKENIVHHYFNGISLFYLFRSCCIVELLCHGQNMVYGVWSSHNRRAFLLTMGILGPIKWQFSQIVTTAHVSCTFYMIVYNLHTYT
jgi:hypothetical protein